MKPSPGKLGRVTYLTRVKNDQNKSVACALFEYKHSDVLCCPTSEEV